MTEQDYMTRVRSMEPSLYRVARSILWNDWDAADAIQEATLKGWKAAPRLRDEDRFPAWMMRILVNECRNLQRRRLRDKNTLTRLIEWPPPPPPPDPGLAEALSRLPDRLSTPLMLHYCEGYTMQDIGKIVGIPPGRVKSRLYEARQALSKLLKEGKPHA